MAALQADVGVRLIAANADLRGCAAAQAKDAASRARLCDVLELAAVWFDPVAAAARAYGATTKRDNP
jgi:hypothetical protein